MAMALKLGKRDKNALALMFFALAVFAALQFVLFPQAEKRETLERRIEAAAANLEEMEALRDRLMAESAAASQAGESIVHAKGFSLFSFMEKVAGQAGVKNAIAYIKPSSTEKKGTPYKLVTVEMKLDAVTLSQLLLFLYQAENSAYNIHIGRIAVSKTSKPEGFITAVLQVETLVDS